MKPFSEVAQHEQGASVDPFFASGSSPSIGDDASFITSLQNKSQIRLSFNVANPVQMLGNSSSIYYYDNRSSQWLIPTKSIPDHTGPFQKYSSRLVEQNTVAGGTINKGSRYVEDSIGFDALGFCVASGTLNIVRNVTGSSDANGNQTSDNLCASFLPRQQIEFMTGDYPKNIQRNSDYDAQSTFTLPIDQAFLIEKAVFEIPIAMGPRWFNDKTIMLVTGCIGNDRTLLYTGSTYMTASTAVSSYTRIQDEGGPGITVSLMCQRNYGTSSIRDLVTKSLITHSEDASPAQTADFSVPGFDSPTRIQWRSHILGMTKTAQPDLIVTVPSSRSFTGSILLKSTPETTNGVKLYFSEDVTGSAQLTKSDAIISCLESISYFLSTPYTVFSSSTGSRQTTGIDTFGRGFTGFAPSGGSIFGREYGAIDFKVPASNPFYVSDVTERTNKLGDWYAKSTDWQNRMTISGGKYTAGVTFNTSVYLTGSKESPYLVRPGDKLLLAISKKRPTINSAKLDIQSTPSKSGRVNMLSSSYYNNIGSPSGHDVSLITGSINITLYGSYVRENKEYIP